MHGDSFHYSFPILCIFFMSWPSGRRPFCGGVRGGCRPPGGNFSVVYGSEPLMVLGYQILWATRKNEKNDTKINQNQKLKNSICWPVKNAFSSSLNKFFFIFFIFWIFKNHEKSIKSEEKISKHLSKFPFCCLSVFSFFSVELARACFGEWQSEPHRTEIEN